MSKRADMMEARTRKHRDAAARATAGFVRTPAALADRIVSGHRDIGSLPAGARVVEPSAGDGALVREILDANKGVHVIAVEPSEERAAALDALAAEHPGRVTVWHGTFENYAETCTYPDGRSLQVDAVVMNPPFGDSQTADLWMSHVRTAWEMLRPGCVVVAIVPPSYAYRSTRTHKEFRTWAESNGATFEKLDGQPFAESGTGTSAGILTIPRPMLARADGLPTWLYAPSTAAPIAVKGDPWVTAAGAIATPVQEYEDRSDGSRPRVIRYVGTCHGCGRVVWDHDGSNDSSVWECQGGATAENVGKLGPAVCLCLECANDGGRFAAALAAGEPHWTDGAAYDGDPFPCVLPGDLGAGNWATVRGVDARGWDFTITGRVMRDPEPVADVPGVPFRHDRVAVALRTARGCDVELYALDSEPVTVHDAPADAVPAVHEGPRPFGLPETATGRTVGGYTIATRGHDGRAAVIAEVSHVELDAPAAIEPAAVWSQPLSGDYGNMFATRHPVRVQPVTVVGDVAYEPGMVRVRTADGEVIRTLREYVTLDAAPGAEPAQVEPAAPFVSRWAQMALPV